MFMKLFLVEDATIYMILLQKLLENDFQITLSKNIADAKKIIEDEDYQFDVMLIDLIMPGTMDLIRQIKKNKRLSQVPIVALTASDNPKDLIQAFDYGIYDCIQKPIYEEVVLQRVKNAASNYLRLKELKKLRESLMNNQQIDDLTKIYKFDTAKWLIDEKLDENKTGQKILFVFKLNGLEEVYKQEGSHRGDELVKEMMSQYEVYVFEADKMIQGFVGLNDEYIEGIFVSDEMQSCGIGKLLLDYVKDKKVSLRLNVYQKNARAISFYQREGFIIQCEGLDEATGEKEYTMLWKQK